MYQRVWTYRRDTARIETIVEFRRLIVTDGLCHGMKRAIGAVAVIGVACAGAKVIHELQNRDRLIDTVEPDTVVDTTDTTTNNDNDESDERFSCDECEKSFDTEHGRSVHKGIVHKENDSDN